MPISTKMPTSMMTFFKMEIAQSKLAFADRRYRESWTHLERAHILGQPYPLEHTLVHWKMLCFALRIKNVGEIIGQLPRLFIGGLKSFVGHIPLGNTGGADVPALKPMEIPEDLQLIIDQNKY